MEVFLIYLCLIIGLIGARQAYKTWKKSDRNDYNDNIIELSEITPNPVIAEEKPTAKIKKPRVVKQPIAKSKVKTVKAKKAIKKTLSKKK